MHFETISNVLLIKWLATHKATIKAEYAHILAMVNVVPAHDRMRPVFHPNAGQSIATNFIVLVEALRFFRHNKTHILAV